MINISEGSDSKLIDCLADTCRDALIDLHVDPHHNRSVFTLAAGDIQSPARSLVAKAIRSIDLSRHLGVHPRIGVVDVVPFVPIVSTGATLEQARGHRDAFAKWLASDHDVPCFLYGSEVTLPDLRRRAFIDLPADVGPSTPHPTAGSTAVGARMALVAYNLWLSEPLAVAKRIAKSIRCDGLRTLGLQVGDHTQVSCNLIDPLRIGPDKVFDLVAAHTQVQRAELVGLVPFEVFAALPRERLEELDIDEERTIESRLQSLQ